MTCRTVVEVSFSNVGAEFSLVLPCRGSLFRTVSSQISDGSRVDRHHTDQDHDRSDVHRNVCSLDPHGALDTVAPSTPAHDSGDDDVPTGLDAIPSDCAIPIVPGPRQHHGMVLGQSLRDGVEVPVDLD